MQEIVPVDFRRAFCPLEGGGGGGRHTGTRLTIAFIVLSCIVENCLVLNSNRKKKENMQVLVQYWCCTKYWSQIHFTVKQLRFNTFSDT